MTRSDAPARDANYRGMLALVIILGVLIVLGVIGLIVGIVFRSGNRAVVGAPYAASFDAAGSHVESAEIDGNRILLRLSGSGGGELVLLDAATGRVVGRIKLENGS